MAKNNAAKAALEKFKMEAANDIRLDDIVVGIYIAQRKVGERAADSLVII